MADTTEGTGGGGKHPASPQVRKPKGASPPRNYADRRLLVVLAAVAGLWVLTYLYGILGSLDIRVSQEAFVVVVFLIAPFTALVLLVWFVPNIVARIWRRHSVPAKHWLGLLPTFLICSGLWYLGVWRSLQWLLFSEIGGVVLVLLIALFLIMIFRVVRISRRLADAELSTGRSRGRTMPSLGKLLLTGLLLCAAIAGSLFWYQSHRRADCDRFAQGNARSLAASVERFVNEAADLGCPKPKITQKFVPFFVGPYYGWGGTSRRCKVRVRVLDNAVHACALDGSRPQDGDSRQIYRVDLATSQELPSTIGPCYGQEYGGAQAPCYISSLLNSDCSLPWTRKKQSKDDAERVSGCEKTKEKNKERNKAFEALARSSLNRLGVELYGKLLSKDENLVFSPLGLFMPLAMAYAGAAGETKAQMGKVMGIDPSNADFHATLGPLAEELKCAVVVGDGQLRVDSAVTGQAGHPFRPEYQDLIQTHYGVGLSLGTLDNREAGQQGAQHPDTKLILANEVYFKGSWKTEFKFAEKDTNGAPFFLLDGKQIEVPTMSAHQKPFKYMEGKNFQGLEMMYEGGDVSMVIFLPREKNGLPDLEKQLTIENLTRWLEKLEPWKYGVDVYLPKFLMTSNLDLVAPLERLGMKEATNRKKADFTALTVGRGPMLDLYIFGFTQKVWLEVNEEGTEAFAQSTLCMNITGSDGDPPPKPEPKIFRADHPFLFLVRHNPTNCLIFLGRMTAPF